MMELFKLVATLGMDSSEYVKGIKDAKKSMTGLKDDTKRTADDVKKSMDDVASGAKKSVAEYRSDVMKLAQTYKKQGMDMSAAMKKAYAEIDESMYDFTKSSKQQSEKAKRHWWQFGKAVEDVGESSFGKLTKTVSAKTIALGVMLAHAVEKAASAAVKLGKSTIEASAEIAAENAQFEAAFGALEFRANKAFSAIGKDTNIISTRLKNVGTKAFAQFKGAGLGAAEALEKMDTYTRLASDAAAYYDISLEDADTRLRSFLRGNTEAGDAIGLFTSETQRNAKAMEMYKKKWTALTEAQKQLLMLDIASEIYEQSGAIGQAEREGHEWTNVVANLKEAWRQTLGIIGEPIRAAIIPVIEKVTTFLQDETVQNRLEIFAFKLGEIAGATFDNALAFFNWLVGNADELKVDIKFPTWEEIKETAGTWWAKISGPEGLQRILVAVFGVKPEQAGKAISTITTYGKNLVTRVEGFFQVVFGVLTGDWEAVAQGIETWWGGVWNGISDLFSAIFKVDLPSWSDVADSINSWWDNVKSELVDFVINIGVKSPTAKSYGLDTFTEKETLKNQQDKKPTDLDLGTGLIYGGSGNSKPEEGGGSRKFATGLDYVPYNDYAALLHEGEAVLTKAEARNWREGRDVSGQIDAAALGEVVGQAVREALDGVGVYMGAERVGDLVTERVSRNIARGAQARRYGMA